MTLGKSIPFSLAAFFAAISISNQAASGAVVFQGDTTNSIVGDNANNSGAFGLTGNSDGTLTLSNGAGSGNNNATFIASGTTVAGSLGRELTSDDTVTLTISVNSSTLNPNANGFEFGLQNGTGFRSNPNLLFQIDDAGNRGGLAPFFSTSGPGANINTTDTPGATEGSLTNGFTATAVYDSTGITYTVSDIVLTNVQAGDDTGANSYTFFFTDDDYEANFETLVGDSSAYFSQQRAGGGGSDTIISDFSIHVATVPEPTSALLLALSSCFMLRRRR